MYVPHFNAMPDEADVQALVAAVGAGQLITTGPSGYPQATFLPLLWRDSTVVAHFARANPHWKAIAAGSPALVVVTGPDAYISPSWYAAKAEHGKVVPTWNYSAVELTGRATVRDDPEFVRSVVTALTDLNESSRPEPWAVTDAPADYIDGMLRAIVGVEITVESFAGKAKWSQNRSTEDRAGVIAGLGDSPVARAMQS